jgi:hypothetical protein
VTVLLARHSLPFALTTHTLLPDPLRGRFSGPSFSGPNQICIRNFRFCGKSGESNRRVLTMKPTIFFLFAMFLAGAANAQERKAPEMKMLTPAECALITKRSDNEFYIKGPVTIGGMTFAESSLTRKGIVNKGVDNFDVVNRSCFNGKAM